MPVRSEALDFNGDAGRERERVAGEAGHRGHRTVTP
jgi:hypothetical protein